MPRKRNDRWVITKLRAGTPFTPQMGAAWSDESSAKAFLARVQGKTVTELRERHFYLEKLRPVSSGSTYTLWVVHRDSVAPLDEDKYGRYGL